jgi:acetyltransferase-like isoleucine patch superfamily enzyme
MKAKLSVAKPSELGKYVVLGELPGDFEGELRVCVGPRSVIRSHTVIYAGVEIGSDFKAGHGALIREGTRIGDHVSVGSGTVIEHHVEIGDGVRIHSNAFIPEFTVIEAGAWIGPNAVLTNAMYPKSQDAKKNLKGPYLETGCMIGANVTLLPGVRIGKGSLVGAGSVVVGDLPAGVVAVGNPARVIRKVSELSAYRQEPSKEIKK